MISHVVAVLVGIAHEPSEVILREGTKYCLAQAIAEVIGCHIKMEKDGETVTMYFNIQHAIDNSEFKKQIDQDIKEKKKITKG